MCSAAFLFCTNTTRKRPAGSQSSPLKLCSLTHSGWWQSVFKLNRNYLSAFDELCKSDCSQSKWHWNWSDRRQAFCLLSACDQKWLWVCNTLKLWANIYSPKVFIYAFIFGRCKEIPVLSVTEPLASSNLGCIFVKLSVFNVRLTLSEDGGAWDEPSCL